MGGSLRNVIRGVFGGVVGALTGGVLFALTWYALALMAGPVSGPRPGLYFSLALGTLAGVFLGMGTRARMGHTVRVLSASLGLGVVGLMVGHFGGRLVYWAMGDPAGSLGTLGTVTEGARAGLHTMSIVGALVGVLAGSLAGSAGVTEAEEAPEKGRPAALEGEGAGPEARLEEPPGRGLPRSKAPGVDKVPMGEHPADSMSVEELLSDQD